MSTKRNNYPNLKDDPNYAEYAFYITIVHDIPFDFEYDPNLFNILLRTIYLSKLKHIISPNKKGLTSCMIDMYNNMKLFLEFKFDCDPICTNKVEYNQNGMYIYTTILKFYFIYKYKNLITHQKQTYDIDTEYMTHLNSLLLNETPFISVFVETEQSGDCDTNYKIINITRLNVINITKNI